jgi:transcriptional regulator with XRE-family HTH domain
VQVIERGIGLRIKELRDNRGMSQEGFGKVLEVTQQYIGALESEKRKPGRALVFMISKKFGVPEEWLLVGEGAPPKF